MKRENQKRDEYLKRAAAIAFALMLWQAAAMALSQRLLLVSPIQVAVRLGSLLLEGSFWRTVLYSFLRIEAGFLLGLFAGAVLAAAAARFSLLEILIWPFMTAVKSVPVASFIILSLIWLGASGLSVFISFLMVLPIVYFNVLEGMKSTDRKLLEMAEVFAIPWGRRMRYLYLPQVKPFLLSACRTALGISWKAGIAAEVIGIPDGSIGERLYEAKIYLDTADLFAWTLVIVLLSALFEKLFLWGMKKGFARLESA
ncbi:ABC transporter permease [Fusibacillus kribbianus]|uniref:ABC transporter permease subunit n=1 Tax=Fusibacillus kribbianus TaxID=3044208 RepID=A0AAP4BCM2_9FIRM|nr:ABC transporter permease subunit [Ruminococcus sp. YH-rum2234]MDI9241864.1 ABC transporter permease subunit [Ruminococcus sp. YH-rum2234]